MDKIEQKKRSRKFRKHLRYDGEIRAIIKKEEISLSATPVKKYVPKWSNTGLPIGTLKLFTRGASFFPDNDQEKIKNFNDWTYAIAASAAIGTLLGLLLINF